MYDFAGKSFDDMTVAELHSFLTQPEIAPHVPSKFNSKTRKPQLIEIASAAHRSFHDSGDADKARALLLDTVDVANMPAEPAQGLNEDRTERAKLEYIERRNSPEPMSTERRMSIYGDNPTPAQRRRTIKKARKHAASEVRLEGGYAHAERV